MYTLKHFGLTEQCRLNTTEAKRQTQQCAVLV
jgi:hypothetical protein